MKILTNSQTDALQQANTDLWIFLYQHSLQEIAKDGDLIIEYSRRLERLNSVVNRVLGTR